MFLLRPFRFLARALLIDSAPNQLAIGFALGTVIGLIPKGNLIAAVLMMVLCALRVNLAAGMAAVFVFSWVGMFLDGASHQLGHWLLTNEALKPVWTYFYDSYLIPWTGFNNTVVLGNLVIALTLFVPVWKLSLPLFAKYTPPLVERIKKYRLSWLLLGGELTGKVT